MKNRAQTLVVFVTIIWVSIQVAKTQTPDGYELLENTLSPNERYGVLYSTEEDFNEKEFPPNLLVRLNPYRLLAEIRPGTRPQATLELHAEWNGNSCVALYQFRTWGLFNLWIYKLEKNDSVIKQNVLEAAREIFRKDIRERLLKKYPEETEAIIFVSPEGEESPKPDFEFRGHQLLLNLFAENKPNLAPGPHWTAKLQATWDIETGKFIKVQLVPYAIELRKNR